MSNISINFQEQGDVQNCTNYQRIKLVSHIIKLCEMIIEHHLSGVTNYTKNQFGFMSERSNIETIFLVRQLMIRCGEQKKDMYMVFIDLEKVYNKVPKNIM
jgi:hypothetical protein